MPNGNNERNIRSEIAEYAKKIKSELDSEKPSVYAPVVWAYQDLRVQEGIAKRLEAGEILISCNQIIPDRAMRRERVYFAFSPEGRLDASLDGILVQVGDDNSVAEIVNPFDVSLAADILPATAVDTLALSATRATLSDQIVQDDTAAQRLEKQWEGFVAQPELTRFFGNFNRFGGGFGGTFGGGGLSHHNTTMCGGTPTNSAVISETGSKEDPDQDTRGSYDDDSGF